MLRRSSLLERHRLLKIPEEGNEGKVRDRIMRKRSRDDVTTAGWRTNLPYLSYGAATER